MVKSFDASGNALTRLRKDLTKGLKRRRLQAIERRLNKINSPTHMIQGSCLLGPPGFAGQDREGLAPEKPQGLGFGGLGTIDARPTPILPGLTACLGEDFLWQTILE